MIAYWGGNLQKKTRKQELDQESEQEKKEKLSFFLGHFLGWVLVFFFSSFLTFLFPFINSHLSIFPMYLSIVYCWYSRVLIVLCKFSQSSSSSDRCLSQHLVISGLLKGSKTRRDLDRMTMDREIKRWERKERKPNIQTNWQTNRHSHKLAIEQTDRPTWECQVFRRSCSPRDRCWRTSGSWSYRLTTD